MTPRTIASPARRISAATILMLSAAFVGMAPSPAQANGLSCSDGFACLLPCQEGLCIDPCGGKLHCSVEACNEHGECDPCDMTPCSASCDRAAFGECLPECMRGIDDGCAVEPCERAPCECASEDCAPCEPPCADPCSPEGKPSLADECHCGAGEEASMEGPCEPSCTDDPVGCVLETGAAYLGSCNELTEVAEIDMSNGNWARLFASTSPAAGTVTYFVSWGLDAETITVGVDHWHFATGLKVIQPGGVDQPLHYWMDVPQANCMPLATYDCLGSNAPAGVTWGLRGGVTGAAGSTTHTVSFWVESSWSTEAEVKVGLTEMSGGGSITYTITLGASYTWSDLTVFDSELLMGGSQLPMRPHPLSPANACIPVTG